MQTVEFDSDCYLSHPGADENEAVTALRVQRSEISTNAGIADEGTHRHPASLVLMFSVAARASDDAPVTSISSSCTKTHDEEFDRVLQGGLFLDSLEDPSSSYASSRGQSTEVCPLSQCSRPSFSVQRQQMSPGLKNLAANLPKKTPVRPDKLSAAVGDVIFVEADLLCPYDADAEALAFKEAVLEWRQSSTAPL